MTTPETSDALISRPVEAPLVTTPSDAPAPTTSATKRSRVPWIVVGVVLAVLLVAGGVVAALLLLAPKATAGPAEAVLGYDQAYADGDCDLFVAVTTVDYREALAPTCADFESEAQNFADHFSDYVVVVESTEITGGTATVQTTETWLLDGEESSAEYTYSLVDDNGSWKIDALD